VCSAQRRSKIAQASATRSPRGRTLSATALSSASYSVRVIVPVATTAVGVHAYVLATVGTVLALVVLEGFRWLEKILAAGNDREGT